MSYRRAIVVDTHGWVLARGTDGSTLKSQTVDSHLLLAILEEMQALRADVAVLRKPASPDPTREQP